jgi:hypothetical protein
MVLEKEDTISWETLSNGSAMLGPTSLIEFLFFHRI